MTPETIKTLTNLRREFYTLFADDMDSPVKISGSSYMGGAFLASWKDDSHYLNYICIYAYVAPDEFHTKRPFILRLAINKGAGDLSIARKGPSCQGLNHKWSFELTVLPEEIMDFLPWIITLIEARSKGLSFPLYDVPYELSFELSKGTFPVAAWTYTAKQQTDRHRLLASDA